MKLKILAKTLFLASVSLFFVACGNDEAKSQSAFERIKKEGVLRVGTEGTYSPFSYHNEKDELVGYDVEVARAVGEKMGVKVEFVEAPWDAMLAAFDAGKSDVVFNQVTINEDRKKKYDYTLPYIKSRSAIVVHKDNDDIKDFSDLKGKSSAHSATSNWAKLAESYGANIVTTDGFSKAVELIITKRADATINDDVTFYDYLKQKPDAPIKIAKNGDEAILSAGLVKKGETDLVNAINEAIKELQNNGKIKEISIKYFGKDISQ
ncbi:amino acid ABC transporter substrate-binding protein [Campylobacter gastrosuis]|uniref:Amino acid ABC transporter substrate-binding protein n=1 Tax=Campylobacter gastrosuis TaxID=2974576 RepID=A0ABT7HRV0_9BACT|nr:amino acid ABC transporter substrate-binding protein [Campylobacter gastrosuis]MDL0089631.1 amino acid ABC transporter substrate-binding protein [Campylobacter gastrosuis]